MTPEFPRRVPLARIGGEPFRWDICASEPERAALARRFDLLALDRLCARVALIRRAGDLIELRATFEGDFVQRCSVTLDPVAGTACESFSLLYGPPDAEPESLVLDDDAPVFEPLDGDAIDIGEAVAQEFSLALPAFPRSPGADVRSDEPLDADGRFAALAALVDRADKGAS